MENINKTLSENQIDQLRQQLIVPLATADILHHDLAVEPDMQYGLHLALSEIDPDSALLAIALCALDIAANTMIRAPIAYALHKEASQILEDYGHTWLHHFYTGPMSDNDYETVLQTVPEDLEALADLIDALCADLSDEHCPAVILGQLLSIQARAHMEIADYILAEIEFEKTSTSGETFQSTHTPVDTDALNGNNIILFPGTKN